VGREHLVQVLGLELLALLGDLPRRAKTELLQAGAREILAQQPDPQDQRRETAQQDDGKGVHRTAV